MSESNFSSHYILYKNNERNYADRVPEFIKQGIIEILKCFVWKIRSNDPNELKEFLDTTV